MCVGTKIAAVFKSACLVALLACAAGLILFPIRSAQDGGLAEVSIYFGGEGESPGIFYDRDFDFPTGYPYFDIPVWTIQAALGGIAVMLIALLIRRQSNE